MRDTAQETGAVADPERPKGTLKTGCTHTTLILVQIRYQRQSVTALVLLALLVFASSSHPFAQGQAVVATTNVGGTSYGVAYDSGKGEVFVTHFFNDTITVLSDASNQVATTVHFGQNYEPVGIAYDSGKGELFVANYGANTVSVVSDATYNVITNVSVGAYPQAVTYDSGKGEVFVASGTSRTAASVTVISDATNAVVATVPVGNDPTGIAYDSSKGEVFVSGSGANSVSVISDSTNTVSATVNVGAGPSGVAYDPNKGEAFVSNYAGNTVSVISDTTNSVVATAKGLLGPSGIAFDPANGEVFVADEGNVSVKTTSVSVIDDNTNTVTTNVNTGVSNTVLAYDSGKGEVFVGGSGDNIVAVISVSAAAASTSASTASTALSSASSTTTTSTCFTPGSLGYSLSVTCTSFSYNTGTAQGGPGTVGVGLYPLGLAYDSGTGEVFVADFTSPAVAAISDATNSVVATVEVPGLNNPGFTDNPSPQYVAYDSAKGEIFASNLYGDCITVISDATNTVVATIGLGNNTVNNGVGLYPVQLAYDSAKGEIFVVEQGPTTIVGSYDASAGAVSIISDATNKVIATVPQETSRAPSLTTPPEVRCSSPMTGGTSPIPARRTPRAE